MATHDRGVLAALLAAALLTMMLLVMFDLDRPRRGVITIPDRPLTARKASMEAPPSAPAAVTPGDHTGP